MDRGRKKNSTEAKVIQEVKIKNIKNPIKYQIQLNDEEKAVKTSAYEKDIIFLVGKAGSGKTLTACHIALDMLHKGEVNQIIVCRPFDFKPTGYLTGGLDEKLEYHIMPIKHNFYQIYNHTKIDEYFKESKIKILPIPYLRGITFLNSAIIVDEIQEMDYSDFELVLTRLGKNSKLLFTGSVEQNVIGSKSCINQVYKLKDCHIVAWHELTSNHRNENIFEILNFLKNNS